MALLENHHNSSMIESTIYDEATQVLTVEFKNGSEYDYHDVDIDTYESLISASSVGSFFVQHIKNNYSYTAK